MRRVRWVALAATALSVTVAGTASAVTLPGQSVTMSVSGRVTDGAGHGIRGMCVEIDGTDEGSLLAEVGSSSTDTNGNYRVTWQQSPSGAVQAPYTAFATADCGAGGWWQQATY